MLLAGLLLGSPAVARAATIQLHAGLAGADSDAILDGFPGLAPFDGVGDLPGNALAVALKAGVTEERALVELPLAPLLAAGADVVSAFLSFNVDDVLTTFGTGTEFDGSAGERILVSTYAGNGVVDLDDFPRGALAATVPTGPHGSITDASVRSSGPIDFAVDLTASVRALLAQGATHIGIAFATDDGPTGTSIDDLGDAGAGPPGANGATMPFLVVTIADATPTPAATGTPVPTGGPTATARPGATSSPVPTPSARSSATPIPTASTGPIATATPPSGTATPVPSADTTPTPGQATPPPSATPTGVAATATAGVTPIPGASTTPRASATPVSTLTPRPTPTPAATGAPQLRPTPRPIATPSPRQTTSPGGGPATPAPTGSSTVPPITLAPDGSGDQLVFYYDARDTFTTFLNLHNLGTSALDVRVVLYDTDLAQPFEHVVVLPGGATRTVDVSGLRSAGLQPRAGAAFASAIDASGAATVSRALAGSFTIANLATGSAWGAPAAARRAVAIAAGGTTIPGTEIDGGTVRLRAIHPDRLGLPAFYDPQTLEPAARGGNQLVFVSFDDTDGVVPAAVTTTWSVDARRSDGTRLVAGPLAASGVVASHLEELLGPDAGGAAGSVTFTTEGGATSRLIYFTESLGTFATGYLLPPVAP